LEINRALVAALNRGTRLASKSWASILIKDVDPNFNTLSCSNSLSALILSQGDLRCTELGAGSMEREPAHEQRSEDSGQRGCWLLVISYWLLGILSHTINN